MSRNASKQESDGHAVENQTPSCRPASKWAASINDKVIPMPRRHVSESILRDQGSVPPDHVIVRDHNSPKDTVIEPGTEVDLTHGEVFYSVPRCEVGDRRGPCSAPPKRLVVVDDRPEIVVCSEQTGKSIRELFGLKCDVDLFRDLESPNDRKVEPDEAVDLDEGNVFVTRGACGLRITVNNQVFREADGVRKEMTGDQIAKLVFPNAPNPVVKRIAPGPTEEIPLNKTIPIKDCDEFRVIRRDIVAGFQIGRVERELQSLREGGVVVTLLAGENAVVFHDVPTSDDGVTDVLVTIPSAYPACMLDNAYLPVDSPFLKTAPGAEQEVEGFGGRKWRKKSIHPHSDKNNNPWDQNFHGLHTYYGHILSWLA